MAGTTDIEDIATSFGQSAEAQLIVNTLSNPAFIDLIYVQSFSRHYDPIKDGTFWLDAIEAGITTKELAFIEILQGAQGLDADVVKNKVAVALTFTQLVDPQAYNRQSVAALAADILSQVTADPMTLSSGNMAARQLAQKINQVDGHARSSHTSLDDDMSSMMPSDQHSSSPVTQDTPLIMLTASPNAIDTGFDIG